MNFSFVVCFFPFRRGSILQHMTSVFPVSSWITERLSMVSSSASVPRQSWWTGNQANIDARLSSNWGKMAIGLRGVLSFILLLIILSLSWLVAVLLDYYTGYGVSLKPHKRTNSAPFPNDKLENLFWFVQVGICMARFHFRSGVNFFFLEKQKSVWLKFFSYEWFCFDFLNKRLFGYLNVNLWNLCL